MIYELTDPQRRGSSTTSTSGCSASPRPAAAEDLGPEGVIVIGEDESPNGKPLLGVANEVSGTTRIFEIAKVKD